jgi:hypothetical protein
MIRLLLAPLLLLTHSAFAGAPRVDRAPLPDAFATADAARGSVGDGLNAWVPAARTTTYARIQQTLGTGQPVVVMDRAAFESGGLPPVIPPRTGGPAAFYEPSSSGRDGALRVSTGGLEVVIPYKGASAPGNTVSGRPMITELIAVLDATSVPTKIEQVRSGDGYVYVAWYGERRLVLDGSLTDTVVRRRVWIASAR